MPDTETPRPSKLVVPNLQLIEERARSLERAIERQATLTLIWGVLNTVELAPNVGSSQELFRALLVSIEAGWHRS